MSAARLGLTRLFFLTIFSAWALVMVYVGLSVLLGPVATPEISARWLRVAALGLVAGGVFIFALLAARCFPQANPQVTLSFELAPWVLMLGVLIGGWL